MWKQKYMYVSSGVHLQPKNRKAFVSDYTWSGWMFLLTLTGCADSVFRVASCWRRSSLEALGPLSFRTMTSSLSSLSCCQFCSALVAVPLLATGVHSVRSPTPSVSALSDRRPGQQMVGCWSRSVTTPLSGDGTESTKYHRYQHLSVISNNHCTWPDLTDEIIRMKVFQN